MIDGNSNRLSDVVIVVLSSIGCYLEPLLNYEHRTPDRYLTNIPKLEYEEIATIHGVPVWNEFSGRKHSSLPLYIMRYAFVLLGNERWYYVIANVIINSCSSALFYLFCSNLIGQSAAFYASLIFYLHPIHSEVVCDVVGLPHLIGCLSLMTWCWLSCDVTSNEEHETKQEETKEKKSGEDEGSVKEIMAPETNTKWKYGMKFLLSFPFVCLCSFISLEVGFTLFLLQLIVQLPESCQPKLRPHTFINIILMSVIFHFHLTTREECPSSHCDVINAIRSSSNGLLHLAYPSNPPYQQVTAYFGGWDWLCVASFFLVLAALKFSKALMLGVVLLIAPISVSVVTTCSTTVTSLYLASAGLSIITAIFMTSAAEKHENLGKMAKVVLVMVLVSFAGLTLRRNFEWKDRESAIRSSFARNPNCSELAYEIGKLELQTGSGEMKAMKFFVKGYKFDHSNTHFLLSAAWILENYVQTRADQEKVMKYLRAAGRQCRNSSAVINRKTLAFRTEMDKKLDPHLASRLIAASTDDPATLTSLLHTVTSSKHVDDVTAARMIAVAVRKACGCSETSSSSEHDDDVIDWSSCVKETAPLADLYLKVKETERDKVHRWFTANGIPDCDVITSNEDTDENYAAIMTCIRQNRFTDRALRLATSLADKNPAKADEILNEIMRKRPNDAVVQFEKAALLRDRGKWKRAAEICRKLIQIDLKCADLHTSWKLLIKYHDRNGQTPQSVNLYRMCLKRLRRRLKSTLLDDDVMVALKRDTSSVRFEIASRLRMISHGKHRNGEKQASLVAWKENLIHLKKAIELIPNSEKAIETYEKLKDVDHTQIF